MKGSVLMPKSNSKQLVKSARDFKSSKASKHISSVFQSAVRYFILLSIGYIVLYPLIYMVSASFSAKESFLDPTSVWIPTKVTLDNFKFMWGVMDYGKAFLSTLRIPMVSAVIEIATCAIVAYGFARFKFPFRRMLFSLLFVTMLIPSAMIAVPSMVNFSKMDILGIFGLLNKLTGVDIRPNLLGTAWTFYLPAIFASGIRSGILIYIYIQFFKGLPSELEEAAWIDGATPLRTFISIALPSSSVVILTVSVFSVIWYWNDYFLATMYMDENYPLAVTMGKLNDLINYAGIYLTPDRPEGLAYLMVACLMFILPPLIFYLIVQRWFVESIDRVGITG